MDKLAQIFGDYLPPKTAKKIIDLLDEKNLPPEKLVGVGYQIRDAFIKKKMEEEYEKRVVALEDVELKSLVDTACSMWQSMECRPCYSENATLYAEMHIDKTLSAGDTIDIQIMKVGKRNHPSYGKFEITAKTLDDIVKNFDSDERGVDLAVDENHEPDHKALGRYKKVYKAGADAVFATIELTKQGAEVLSKGLYKYFSPEIMRESKDAESGKKIKNLLIGGAFTNRPFFKGMQSLMASEATDSQSLQSLYFFNTKTMFDFVKVLSKFKGKTSITKAEFSIVEDAYKKLSDEDKTDEIKSFFDDLALKATDEETKSDEGEEGDDETPPAPEGEKATTPPAEETKEEETTPEGDKPEGETLEATDKKVTISFNEYESLKKVSAENAKLIRASRTRSITDKASEYQFSEKNDAGMVLPKNLKDVVSFALSLSESKENEFFALLGKMRSDIADKFKEIGKNGKGTDEEEFDEEVVKEYEKKGMSKENAMSAAKDYEKTKAKK